MKRLSVKYVPRKGVLILSVHFDIIYKLKFVEQCNYSLLNVYVS